MHCENVNNIPACLQHWVLPDDFFQTPRHWHIRKTCDKVLSALRNGVLARVVHNSVEKFARAELSSLLLNAAFQNPRHWLSIKTFNKLLSHRQQM